MITPAHAFFNWAILKKWLAHWWVIGGSVLPDVPSYLAFIYLLTANGLSSGGNGFFGFIMANGNPNRQPGFMQVSFLLHALPLFVFVGFVLLWWRRKWLLSLWAGWGLHIFGDFLTHVTDAYAPLYPFFSAWRPRGIVSYWEPRYGAEVFQIVQLSAFGLIVAWILGRWVWTRRAKRT